MKSKLKLKLICLAALFTWVFAVIGCLNTSAGENAPAQALNEKMTSDAWARFNAGDYNAAIERARECLNKFKASADREQKLLDDSKEVVPASPDDPKERERIFKRGPLNDVATCLYIEGESHLRLGSKETGETAKQHLNAARAALEAAALYPAARTFDTTNFDPKTRQGGWFWSPAQEAKDILTKKVASH